MYTLLPVFLLLHIATSTIYTVIPDGDYNTTCNHCHKLQHYVLNATKYFTSNTKLLFLPGKHQFCTDLIVQNVHSISLIGDTNGTNGTTQNIVIYCTDINGIIITQSNNITIKNMILRNCIISNDHYTQEYSVSLFLNDCNDVSIQDFTIDYNLLAINVLGVSIQDTTIIDYNLLAINVLGEFTLVRIKAKGIKILYNDERTANLSMPVTHLNHKLSIFQFYLISKIFKKKTATNSHNCRMKLMSDNALLQQSIDFFLSLNGEECVTSEEDDISYGIILELHQSSYNLSIHLMNIIFKQLHGYQVLSIDNCCCNKNIKNTIFIMGCYFVDNTANLDGFSMIDIKSQKSKNKCSGKAEIIIQNCSFINNSYAQSALVNITHGYTAVHVNKILLFVHILGCLFQTNARYFIDFHSYDLPQILCIEKTQFLSSSYTYCALDTVNVQLIFKGTILFHKINIEDSLIRMTGSNITVYKDLNINRITGMHLISVEEFSNINMMESALINITCLSDESKSELFTTHSSHSKKYTYPLYLPCYFQFYGNHTGSVNTSKIMIAINTDTHQNMKAFNFNLRNINCKWNTDSLYYGSNPLEVYSQHFKLLTKNNTFQLFDSGLVCICFDRTHPNCYTNTLQSIFPGQTLKLKMSLNKRIVKEKHATISVKINDKETPHSTCKVLLTVEVEQEVNETCTEVVYTILSQNRQHCKLILYNVNYIYPTVYFIKLLNCPPGFAHDNQKCSCDSKLSSGILTITECDINNQTILRPGNSWLAASIWNDSYAYKVSIHCPFHYCVPHSSHHNFSTPNSQCQFNRTGILCGHCQQGLSSVLGSSHCQQCSNIFLFLIAPFATAGLILVLLLFILNLTVTDGTISALILYANIIGINSPVFFPHLGKFMPAYTFISLANLDLGIQTCFYNGMDEYAKMWLQLTFPFYLIFIAATLIIASRYSTTIQRLTARRALPVLATLFLLSYTKMLLIVSSVLFSYSKIIHLPGEYTTLVWSVDANVPLFSVRFITLFISCFILFLILIPFNTILLFTRWLSRFTLINKFKPLIDAYQGPYKDKMYYWVGLQLVLRMLLFVVSSLDRNNNLVTGIIILIIVIGLHGTLRPFKNEIKNHQEKMFIMNILILFVLALYNHDTTNTTAVNVMIGLAVVQFIFIVIYHIVTYTLSGITRNKLQLYINTLAGLMYNKLSVKQSRLDSSVKDKIPMAVNYQEFREPLIIQD